MPLSPLDRPGEWTFDLAADGGAVGVRRALADLPRGSTDAVLTVSSARPCAG